MAVEAKICGITTLSALDAAHAAGARYAGFVFFPKSPRNIALAAAAPLVKWAKGKIKTVALLVDADDGLIERIMAEVAPDFLQLHGSESLDRVREVRARFGLPLIKAVGISAKADVAPALDYFEPGRAADILLFDAKPPKNATRTGGHGKPFDWSILEDLPGNIDWMLSGGLTAENVGEAIRRTGAKKVDVSSGVESSLGIKDNEMIRRFLHAVKTAKQT